MKPRETVKGFGMVSVFLQKNQSCPRKNYKTPSIDSNLGFVHRVPLHPPRGGPTSLFQVHEPPAALGRRQYGQGSQVGAAHPRSLAGWRSRARAVSWLIPSSSSSSPYGARGIVKGGTSPQMQSVRLRACEYPSRSRRRDHRELGGLLSCRSRHSISG